MGVSWSLGAAIATAALLFVAAAFLAFGEDTEATLFGLAGLGLIVGRILGISNRSTVGLGAGMAVVVSIVVLGGLGHPRLTSSLAHVVIGAMLAWALFEPARARMRGRGSDEANRVVAPVVVAMVLVLGVGWELCEQLIDQLIGTNIELSLVDSSIDLLAGGAGAVFGVLLQRYQVLDRAGYGIGSEAP